MKKTLIVVGFGLTVYYLSTRNRTQTQANEHPLTDEAVPIILATERLQERYRKGLYRPKDREQVRKDLEFEVFLVEHGG